MLSRVGADRADDLRTDIDAAIAGWPEARLMRVDDRNQVLLVGGRVVLGAAADYADKPFAEVVFLGLPITTARSRCVPRLEPAAEPETTVVDPRRTSHPFDDVSAQLVRYRRWHC